MAGISVRLLTFTVAAGMVLAACARQTPTVVPVVPSPATAPVVAPQPAAAQTAPAAVQPSGQAKAVQQPPSQYVGRFALSAQNGPPGTKVTATGAGMPANAQMQLLWNTVKGSWVLGGKWNDEFHGRAFKPVTIPLSTFTTDAAGSFSTVFTVPEGWGFDHDVSVVEAGTGVVRNKANFSVDMQMSISPTSGPPGTPITIEARGIGPRYLYNSWVLMYDNKLTGWLSSVTTNGIATAVIPAAGTTGKHIIKVMHGWSSQAYLNPAQSSEPERPQFIFEFTVTDGPAVLPPKAEQQGLKPTVGLPPAGTGPVLWANPASGPLGTPAKLQSRGLPAGQTVDLVWVTMLGSRLDGWAIEERFKPMGQAVVGQDGVLSFDFKAPDDLGGFHRIEARVGEQVLATSGFTITPVAFSLEPASGPAGTTIRVHLKGVGWTETANIYHLVYDNAYIGYACGFKSAGDVEIFLPASGEPGWHFIDLYPGIYKGKDIQGVINFRTPQLTAEEDHPGEDLPVFRLAFLVTE